MNTYWTVYLIIHTSFFLIKIISQSSLCCIPLYVLKTKYFKFILQSRHIIVRYRVKSDIYMILCKYLLYCYKDLIDLQYKLSEFHLSIKISASATNSSFVGLSCFSSSNMSSIFSLNQKIRAIKA